MRTHVLIGVAAAAMIGLAGCGADSSDSNTPTATFSRCFRTLSLYCVIRSNSDIRAMQLSIQVSSVCSGTSD